MKPEIYQSLSAINQATDQIVQNAEKLRDEGVLVPDFTAIRILEARQNCSDINVSATHYIAGRELEDGAEIGKELREKRRVYSEYEAITPTTTGDQGRTPAERMDNALGTVLKVPKEAMLRKEAKEQRKRKRKREKKRSGGHE